MEAISLHFQRVKKHSVRSHHIECCLGRDTNTWSSFSSLGRMRLPGSKTAFLVHSDGCQAFFPKKLSQNFACWWRPAVRYILSLSTHYLLNMEVHCGREHTLLCIKLLAYFGTILRALDVFVTCRILDCISSDHFNTVLQIIPGWTDHCCWCLATSQVWFRILVFSSVGHSHLGNDTPSARYI